MRLAGDVPSATVITPFDDYPIHQIGAPLAVPATSDANAYDRFFFNGYVADGSVYFGLALGLYPNRGVIDSSFSVMYDGTQTSVHASGRCPDDRTLTSVGPIRVDIVEPMRVHRVTVEAAEHHLRADLVFTARTAPVQEPHFLRRHATRTFMDYTRFTQFGSWSGWIEVEGERIDVDSLVIVGSRDRSWGVRPVGEQPPTAPVGNRQFYWLWAPVNFESLCTHFDVNEEISGERWHESGFIVPLGNQLPLPAAVDYALDWEAGGRWAKRFVLQLTPYASAPYRVVLEPFLVFPMRGIGYGHPTRRHGGWVDEHSVVGESWPLPITESTNPGNVHIQALCRATLTHPDGRIEHGTGILEQLVIGPHAPSGFAGLVDGAAPGATAGTLT